MLPLKPAKIDNLFVPLDGTEWHERAISYGLLLSEWFGAKMNLFFSLAELPPLVRHGEWNQRAHVSVGMENLIRDFNPDSFNYDGSLYEFGRVMAYEYLREVVKHLEHLNVNIDMDVAAGNPAYILTHKANVAGDSIIVMYARPQRRLNRIVGKKTAEELLGVSTVPMMMLNEQTERARGVSDLVPDKVIVPLRAASAMRAALPYVIAILEKSGARIELLRNGSASNQRGKRNQLYQKVETALVNRGFDVTTTCLSTDLLSGVVEAQEKQERSWVVLGSRMRRGLTRYLVPSLVDNLRREVSCPVIAVPQPEIIPRRASSVKRWLVDWQAEQA